MEYILNDVLEIKNGKNQKAVENSEGQYPIYGSGGVIGYADDYICDADTVVIGRKGSINNPIYVSEPFWNVDTAFGLVARREVLLPRYLFYFCKKFDFEKLNKTVTIPSLTKSDLLNIKIKLPDIDEQQLVVDKLIRIESVMEFRKQELNVLDNLIKARFVEMFGDCTNMISLSDLCLIITDGTHQSPKFQHEGIPFILVSNLSKNTVTYDTDKFISAETYKELYKRTPIEIGDILLSTVGSYGHPAVVVEDRKFLFQRHIAYLKPKSDILNSYYMHGALLSPGCQRQIEEKVKGIAQKTLNLSEIRKIRIPVPSLDLQKQYADFVHQVNKSKVAVQKALDETQMLFDSLMQKYFA